MPGQPPQWTEFLSCSKCLKEFNSDRCPITLVCGHSVCYECTGKVQKEGCRFDPTTLTPDVGNLGVNFALLRLIACQNETNLSRPEDPRQLVSNLGQNYHFYVTATRFIEDLSLYLQDIKKGILSQVSDLTKPMQRKLVNLVQCQLALEDGRLRTLRACRALGERSATELILAHQNPTTLSGNLWTEVRARGCQFLGPAMQEEALKLILLALEDGSELSRKVLVMFVVQKLQQQFPQASKTSIGHVVQLLYRASCFVVKKREGDSSLMRLKEIYRTYPSLRREHDAQVVQIAREAGLRIAPDQWSALLYGDQDHKSHMQSVIDRLQSGESFQRCIHDLSNAIKKSGDPGNLGVLVPHFDVLCKVNAESSDEDDQKNDWTLLLKCLESVKKITQELVVFSKNHSHDLWQDEDTLAQTAKYKTSFCRDIRSKGSCPRGATCTFAHSEEELHHYRNKRKKASLGHTNVRRELMTRARSPLAASDRSEWKLAEQIRALDLTTEERKQPSVPGTQMMVNSDVTPHPQYFHQPPPHGYPPQLPTNPTTAPRLYPPGRYPQMPPPPPHGQPLVHPHDMPYGPYPGSTQQGMYGQPQFMQGPQVVRPQTAQRQAPKQTQFHVPLYPLSQGLQTKGFQEQNLDHVGRNSVPEAQGEVDPNMPHLTVTVSFHSKPGGGPENAQKQAADPAQARIKTASDIRGWRPDPRATFSVAHSAADLHTCSTSYSTQIADPITENAVRPPVYNQYSADAPQNRQYDVPPVAYNYTAPVQGQHLHSGSVVPSGPPPGHVLMTPMPVNQSARQNQDQQFFYPIVAQRDTEAAVQCVDAMAPNNVPVLLPVAGPVFPKQHMMPSQDPRVAVVAPQPAMPPPAMTPTLFDPNTNVLYQSPSPLVQPMLVAPSPSPANQPQNAILIPIVPAGRHGAQYQVMDQNMAPEVMQIKQQNPSQGSPSQVPQDLSVSTSINEATVQELERRKDQIIHRLIQNQTEKGRDEATSATAEECYDVWKSHTCSLFFSTSQNLDTGENLHDEELVTNVVDVIADMDTRTSQVTVRGTDHLNMSHSKGERALDDARMHRMILDKHDYRRSVVAPSTAKQPLGAMIHYSGGPQDEDDEMIPFSDRPTVSKYGPIARSVRTRPSNTDVVRVNANADVLTQPVTAVKESGQCETSVDQPHLCQPPNLYSSFENLHAPSFFPTSFVRDREMITAPASRNHPTIPPATGAMTNSRMSPVQAASNSKLLQREATALQQKKMQSYPEDLQLAMELQQIELGIHRKKRQNQ